MTRNPETGELAIVHVGRVYLASGGGQDLGLSEGVWLGAAEAIVPDVDK
jgi:hypothetical protein